jgi:hypothetical protein
MLGDTTLPSVAGLDLQAVDEVDDVVEAAARAGSDAASGDCDGCMCFAGAGTAGQDGVTLLGDEAAAGEMIDQRLVDGCALEPKVLKVLGQRQLFDGELVLDRAGLLLVDLGVEQVADNALGFVLALDGSPSFVPALRVNGGQRIESRPCSNRVEEGFARVCTENLNPNVVVMKSAQDGVRTYDAGSLDLTRDRRILVQRPMRSNAVVIGRIVFQNAAQTFPSDRSDQPFGKAIPPT